MAQNYNCMHFWLTANSVEPGSDVIDIGTRCTKCGKQTCYKKVLVLYTGGTFGMMKNSKGVYVPVKNALERRVRGIPKLHSETLAKKVLDDAHSKWLILPKQFDCDSVMYFIQEYETLLDSSNITPKQWKQIASDIENSYLDYNGFVVLHGTDTLCYTASALSFMLEGLRKPVILTGSSIPIYEKGTDAKSNFLYSLILAGCFDIHEVCIFFAKTLLRGNRTTKVSSESPDAYGSPNYGILAKIRDCISVQVFPQRIIKSDIQTTLKVHMELNTNVVTVVIFPTITGEMMEGFITSAIAGVVLLTYGNGNIPANNKELLKTLGDAVNRGVIIINITQCHHGGVMKLYEPGQIATQIGIISGNDMTAEAALTKLSYVLGMADLSLQERKNLLITDLRGEMNTT